MHAGPKNSSMQMIIQTTGPPTEFAVARCPVLVDVVPTESMIGTCLHDLFATCCSCLLSPSSPPRSTPHQPMATDATVTITITHRTVELNTGVHLHLAEAGPSSGAPTVLLLHGFPELWYTWRHQMLALAAAGYRAVAPDMRGYGGSDAPSGAEQYTALHVVGDLVALVDLLEEKQVFVAAHDWGAVIAWNLCMLRPDRVRALVALSVAFTPRSPARRPVDGLRALYGDEYYICRIQEPGVVEAEFTRLGTEQVLRKFFAYRTPGPLFIPKSGWGSPDDEVPLPSWITEEDIKYYATQFNKTGFTGGLNYYRALNKTWELTSPWTGAEIKVPTKFILGDLDLTYHTTGIQDFIHKGGLKKFVPLLDDVVVMKDVGHFINEEKPEEVSAHILSFIKKFK